MIIPEIRAYIKGVIQECDSDLSMHDDWFVSNDISDNKLDYTYHIQFGSLSSSSRVDNLISVNIPVTVELFYKGKNEVIERFDNAFDTAIDIQSALIDKRRVNQLSFLKSVESTSIEPTPVISNDKQMKLSIQLNCITSYKPE